MKQAGLLGRLRELCQERLPLPGGGETQARHRRLFETGKEDLSLAKLAEAHWDAVAILAEADREPEANAVYGVWASEIPGRGMIFTERQGGFVLNGRKPFASGIGIVDRALLTMTAPRPLLVDVDMRQQRERFQTDTSAWKTTAFHDTNTGSIAFEDYFVASDAIVGRDNFYLERPNFWNGACGPAACWIGGAAALVAYAKASARSDAHTLAHRGAMDATLWMMEAALERASFEIDSSQPGNVKIRALRLRHVVEQGCTDILMRLTRAYGPHPLALDPDISRRYQELDLYLRQTHAERDLETLGREAQ